VEVDRDGGDACIAEHDVTENIRNRLFEMCVLYTWHNENGIFFIERDYVSADYCIPSDIQWNRLGVCSESLMHVTDLCMCV
jgi:hypothetical protein